MRMRLAYCAGAISLSSADAYYENASFVCVPPTCRPHLLCNSSITNWIGVVPCLSGFSGDNVVCSILWEKQMHEHHRR
jgi:hypothetical protein